jgi:hypothetical protein
LEKIEKNERKLEALCSRMDRLENSTQSLNSNNIELEIVTSEQPSEDGNCPKQQVNTF